MVCSTPPNNPILPTVFVDTGLPLHVHAAGKKIKKRVRLRRLLLLRSSQQMFGHGLYIALQDSTVLYSCCHSTQAQLTKQRLEQNELNYGAG